MNALERIAEAAWRLVHAVTPEEQVEFFAELRDELAATGLAIEGDQL